MLMETHMINKVNDNLRFTEDDVEIDVLHRLNEYFDRQYGMRNQFVDSCDSQFIRLGSLSGKQINRLMDIYKEIMNQDIHESFT